MTEAAPEPEGSEEEIKRKFREALERKHARMRTRTRPVVARTPGRSTAPAAWPGADVRFAARPATERLSERIMRRPDDHR
jgi:hypothetical protein